jgi:hypothetical protein
LQVGVNAASKLFRFRTVEPVTIHFNELLILYKNALIDFKT